MATGSTAKAKKVKGAGQGAAVPKSEREGLIFFNQLDAHIKKQKGRFLRDEFGNLHLIIEQRRIPISHRRENYPLAALMLKVCGVSTLLVGAQAAVQRLAVEASKHVESLMLRRFSAASNSTAYIPLHNGRLLRVSAAGIETVENGEENFWVEHPYENALHYSENDLARGLKLFERLLVENQACRVPQMRWFIAMHEGLFPFIRDDFPARMLLVSQGKSQQGKTSGSQRFTLLHGLGKVKGDYTPAALADEGDIGLLVVDNKEQANFTQPYIDFFLFLSTGATRGRSSPDGRVRTGRYQPVGVITTIEGMWKDELKARCVEVEYSVKGEPLERLPIEKEIERYRHVILSALMRVLQRYLKRQQEVRTGTRVQEPTPNPIPEFKEHFFALCNLLRAYGDVAAKPQGWSEEIIGGWSRALGEREPEENELEQPLSRILREALRGDHIDDFRQESVTYQGKQGTLLVTECSPLLTLLQQTRPRDYNLPKNSAGLSRRLHDRPFRSFVVLDHESAPEIAVLKRSAIARPIGFFTEDKDRGGGVTQVTPNDAEENRERHGSSDGNEKT
jgi:hypothetical protein